MTAAANFLDSTDREFDMPKSLKEYVASGLCALEDVTPRKLYGAFSYAWDLPFSCRLECVRDDDSKRVWGSTLRALKERIARAEAVSP